MSPLISGGVFAVQSPHGRNIYDELDSGDPSRVQAAYESIYYTRLTLEDPTNPNGLTDGVRLERDYDDYDGDGNTTESISTGGHLINPAQATITYKDTNGNTLQTPTTYIGEQSNGTVLTNYLVSNGPAMPAVATSWDPTPAERQAILDALSAYHRQGETATFTAPATLRGLPLRSPSSPHTMTLTNPTNTLNFLYTASQTTPTPNNPTQPIPGAPDAGVGESNGTTALSSLAVVLVCYLTAGLAVAYKRA